MLGFGAACCAAITTTGGTLAVAGGLMSMGAAGTSLLGCVTKSKTADFNRHMKAAQKYMEDGLRLDARITGNISQTDIDRSFEELRRALPKFKTDLLLADFARWNLAPKKIAYGLTEKLSRSDISPFFASSAAGRNIAGAVIEQAFIAIKQQDAFWQNMDISVDEEILTRLDGLKDHMTSEADRIITDLTEKLNLEGQNKLSFENAVRHILESTDKRDAAAKEALERRDINAAISIRMSRLQQEDAMMDELNRAKAQEWRDTAALTRTINVMQTITAYEQAIKYDGGNIWDYIELSHAYVKSGNLPKAESALNLAQNVPDISARDQSVVYSEKGDLAAAQGDLTAARKSYELALDIHQKLTAQDKGNTQWQRDLAVSHYTIATLESPDAQSHWDQAYETLKALNDAGKMLPTDKETLEALKNKYSVTPD